MKNPGALERKPDKRDFLLGAIQAPVQIPPSFTQDIGWLITNFQGDTPACGAHAASHLQAILEHQITSSAAQRYSPRYLWIRIKQIDGFPLQAGTDMRSIFKTLANKGADDYEPLENDVTLPLASYSSALAVTPAMDADAANQKIASYAFGNTDFASLCQHIYQNKAVLLLIKCDDGFWGSKTPTFTTPEYGHFVVAYGYNQNGIYIVDSADKDFPLKEIARQYITSEFIIESGTALDIPPQEAQQLIQTAANITQEVSAAPISAVQKFDLFEFIAQAVQSFAAIFSPKVGSASSPNNVNISAFEQAALHACKVIAWALGSAAIPALVALYSGNPYWLVATPFINAAAAGLVKWSGIQAAASANQPSGQ